MTRARIGRLVGRGLTLALLARSTHAGADEGRPLEHSRPAGAPVVEAIERPTSTLAPSVGPDEGPAWGVALRAHFGVATAPFGALALPEAKGHGLTLVADAWVRVRPGARIGARVPLALTSVAQPAGSYIDEAAWGNPELWAQGERQLGRGEGVVTRAIGRAAIGLPLAERAATLLPNRALAIANAIDGWHDPELFTPGVIAVTPSAALSWAAPRWSTSVGLKLPALVRVSDAHLDHGVGSPRALGFLPIVDADARRWLWAWFGVALGANLVFEAARPVDYPRPEPRVQLVVRPSLLFRTGRAGELALEVVAPVAGPLGGSTFGAGVSFRVGP